MSQPVSTSAKSVRQEFVPTLRLALPLAFAELGWMFMGIVDTIMVGRLPNSAIAIGATGLGETLYNMLAIFAAAAGSWPPKFSTTTFAAARRFRARA